MPDNILEKVQLLKLERGKSAPTKQTAVKRGGVLRKDKSRWWDTVDIARISTFDREGKKRAIVVSFTIPAGGQGDTFISVRIGPKDFQAILRAMSATDKQAALLAMSEELNYQIARGFDG